MLFPTSAHIDLLERVYRFEGESKGAAPLHELGTVEESAGIHQLCRELEDRNLLHFSYKVNPADPWGNSLQFVYLSKRGREVLLRALEERVGA